MDSGIKENTMIVVTTLTFNRLNLTKRTLEAFYKHYDMDEKPYHIFVDNGSGDGTVKWLRESNYAAELYVLTKNLGCGCGTSIAMKAAILAPGNPRYILNLENDWLCLQPCMSWAARMLDKHKEADRVALYIKPEKIAALKMTGMPLLKEGKFFYYRPGDGVVTFMPSLMRISRVEEWFPVSTEKQLIQQGSVCTIFPAETDFFLHIGGDPLPEPRDGARWKRKESYGKKWGEDGGWMP
jgi:hypothetical protein